MVVSGALGVGGGTVYIERTVSMVRSDRTGAKDWTDGIGGTSCAEACESEIGSGAEAVASNLELGRMIAEYGSLFRQSLASRESYL